MKNVQMRKNILENESGLITLDFIFAIGLAFGFSLIFFAMSFTLSMVEVAQYITYSSARAFNAANVSQPAQKDLGKAKYDELRNTGVFKTILKSGWVTLGDIEFGDFADEYPKTSADFPADSFYVGARVPFQSKVLNLRLPFLGNTAEDSSTGSATLNAYLLREVSTEECQRFNSERFERLKQLPNTSYRSLPAVNYALITDNGC